MAETQGSEKKPQLKNEPSLLDEVLRDLASGRRSRMASSRARVLDMADSDSVWHADVDARLDGLASHKDAFCRGTAYLALGISRQDAALPLLEAALSEKEADARTDLALSLSSLGLSAAPLLKKLLSDEVFEIRFVAAQGLVTSGALGESDSERESCLKILTEALSFDDTRFEALSALSRLSDERALPAVRSVFGKFFVSGFERVAAAGILARSGDGGASAFLTERIRRKKGMERGLAIEILGELKLPETAGALKDVACDRKSEFRGAALKAFARAGFEGAEALVTDVLKSDFEPEGVRADAAEGLLALALAGSKTAALTLELTRGNLIRHGRQEENAELFEALEDALGEIQGQV